MAEGRPLPPLVTAEDVGSLNPKSKVPQKSFTTKPNLNLSPQKKKPVERPKPQLRSKREETFTPSPVTQIVRPVSSDKVETVVKNTPPRSAPERSSPEIVSENKRSVSPHEDSLQLSVSEKSSNSLTHRFDVDGRLAETLQGIPVAPVTDTAIDFDKKIQEIMDRVGLPSL